MIDEDFFEQIMLSNRIGAGDIAIKSFIPEATFTDESTQKTTPHCYRHVKYGSN